MLTHLRPALIAFAIFTLLTGVAYPLALIGIGQTIAPSAAKGSLVTVAGKVVGSSLIGQSWTSEKYFHGRPSAAGSGYDASASSGSNLGSTSAKLMERTGADVALLKQEGISGLLPADAVTASGSGLDPDISPDYALLQVPRIAKARGLADDQVRKVVEQHVAMPTAGLLGEPRVNVLLLNLALDGVNSPGNG
jgi:potassium-transporting ATPase KdpC subunit